MASTVKLYYPVDSHSDGDLVTRWLPRTPGLLWELLADQAAA